MNCLCPKCSARIELDETQIPEKGSVTHSCPECNIRYLLSRESFARRAYRHAAEICCVTCGSQLDHSLHCPACKTLYPEYLIAEFPEAAKKRAKQQKDIFAQLKNISFQLRKPAGTGGYKPVSKEAREEQHPEKKKKKLLMLGAVLLVVAALVAAGVFMRREKEARKQYAEAYVMAAYGIKLGADTGFKTAAKARSDAAQTTPSKLPPEDEAKLTKQRAQTDKYMEKTKNPPKVFVKSTENLNKLYAVYQKICSATLNPATVPGNFADAMGRMENEFKQTKEELKKELPEEIAAALKTAKGNYKALSDF